MKLTLKLLTKVRLTRERLWGPRREDGDDSSLRGGKRGKRRKRKGRRKREWKREERGRRES